MKRKQNGRRGRRNASNAQGKTRKRRTPQRGRMAQEEGGPASQTEGVTE